MIQKKLDIELAGWQVTATTINCEYTDESVTLMVDRDWTTRCSWYRKYKKKALEDKKEKFEKKIKVKITECAGPDCPLASSYRDKLIKEEFSTKQEK
jgi:hypothetical protein